MLRMSTTHRVFFPGCFLIPCAALVVPRIGQAAEKAYTNSIGMEFVMIPA
jgi:hypothetical protein